MADEGEVENWSESDVASFEGEDEVEISDSLEGESFKSEADEA